MWESNRQRFVVQSTAEAELLGYGEAFSWRIGSFIASAGNHHRDICLSLCLNESGPWTRHLRLRIAHLESTVGVATRRILVEGITCERNSPSC